MRTIEMRTKEKAALEEEDRIVIEAMDEIAGYLDITPEDFLDILHHIRSKGISLPGAIQPVSSPAPDSETPAGFFRTYFSKFLSTTVSPKRVHFKEIAWSWVGSFVGILAVAWLHFSLLAGTDAVMLIGSFGASAVLIYGAVKSPLAQPRNLIGGHVFSALVGAGVFLLVPGPLWLSSALAVSLAIALMHFTGTLHPPGGATALIAIIGSDKIHALGFWYALVPAGLGALVMLIIALFINNLSKDRNYPEYWI